MLTITQSLCGDKTCVLFVQCCEVQQGGCSATVNDLSLGMLTDIRIINYPIHYQSTWQLILFMYFLCTFSKFLRYFTKILYINTSISRILAAGLERTTIRLYFRDFTLSGVSDYEFMILFHLHATTSSQGAGQASMPLRRKNLTKNYTKN